MWTVLLTGVNILNGKAGVHFTFVRDGRPSGEAYIELVSEEDMERALSKDKHHMGKRYIDGRFSSLYKHFYYLWSQEVKDDSSGLFSLLYFQTLKSNTSCFSFPVKTQWDGVGSQTKRTSSTKHRCWISGAVTRAALWLFERRDCPLLHRYIHVMFLGWLLA